MLNTILFFALLFLGGGVILFLICLNSALRKLRQWRTLASLPTDLLPAGSEPPKVRILAFSNAGCRQCRVLQAPVLRRVKEAHEDEVTITDVQAASSPELVERFQVTTFPTTAVFDASGRLYAINYGFANAQCLLSQVTSLLQATQTHEPRHTLSS
jgi:thioredoxin-like negative regulator of GroEL